MTIKQEALNRIFAAFIESDIRPVFEKEGFRYLKGKRAFKKSTPEFDYSIYLHSQRQPLEYHEETESLRFHFLLYTRIDLPAYGKWYQKTFGAEGEFALFNKTPSAWLHFAVDMKVFEPSDFHDPSATQKLKAAVSHALSGGPDTRGEYAATELPGVLQTFLSYFDKYNAIEAVLNDETIHEFQKIDLWIYAGRKEAHRARYDEWRQKLQARIDENPADGSVASYQKEIRELNRKEALVYGASFPEAAKVTGAREDGKGAITVREGLVYEHRLTLNALNPRINGFDVDPVNGRLIISHSDKLVSLWDFAGNKLAEAEVAVDNSTAGFVPGRNCYFITNALYDASLNELFSLNHTKKKKTDTPVIFPTVVNDRLVTGSYKGEIAVYDNATLSLLHFRNDVHGRLIAVLPHRQRLLTYQNKSGRYTLLDLELKEAGTFDLNKNDWVSATAVSPDERYLFAGGYNTKSYLVDLEQGTKTVLWAHETFKKGYKELYHDVPHNFGLHLARFSPGGDRLVVSGDHGKNVVWEIPSLKRRDLSPPYGTAPDALLAAPMSFLHFLDAGACCAVVRGKLCFFDQDFGLLATTGPVQQAKASPDGRVIATLNTHSELSVYVKGR